MSPPPSTETSAPAVDHWDPCLLPLAAAGDPGAQRQVFERWARPVLRWCARLGGPRVDPEEAAQDIWITVFRRLHTLREPRAFETWLFGTTRRVLAAHRRRVWWQRWVGGASWERADSRRQPDEVVASGQTAALVRRILDDLPIAQREVLVLCFIEERSATEAARLLGLPVGTVKSRLRLGRQRFSHRARQLGLAPDPPRLVGNRQ